MPILIRHQALVARTHSVRESTGAPFSIQTRFHPGEGSQDQLVLLFDTKQYIGQVSLMIVFIHRCVIDLGRVGEERWAEGDVDDYERAVASAQQVRA